VCVCVQMCVCVCACVCANATRFRGRLYFDGRKTASQPKTSIATVEGVKGGREGEGRGGGGRRER